jgi:colicin import membrane protein
MSFTLPREDVTAGLLALAVHGFFVLLLVLGVSWQIHNPQPVMADLWQSLPELPRPEPLLPPEPPAEPVPPPKPAPLPEPKPQPKAVVEDRAADIALQKKKQEEKLLKQKEAEELKNKRAEEKKRRDEARRMEVELEREAAQMEADSLKKEQDKKLAEIKLRESLKREEEEMQQRMLEESLAAEAGQLKAKAAADQRASEIEKIVARYKEMISAKIRGNTRLPENLPGNPEVDFNVSVLPTGEIAKISLTKGSGNAAYDEAVRRGIEKSSPLPLPPDKAAAAKFRDLDLKHKARE